MSITKQTKELLDQVRRLLDKESRAAVEPILRSILEVAKPKTVREVRYRRDPKDEAEIERLRDTISSKDNEIRKLRFKLAGAQEELRTTIEAKDEELRKQRVTLASEQRTVIEALRVGRDEQVRKLRSKLAKAHLEISGWQNINSLGELLDVVDTKAKDFMACVIKCMYIEGQPLDGRQKKAILVRSVTVANVVLARYLKRLEACHGIDEKRLRAIIDECSLNALQNVARMIHAESGIDVDLKLNLGGGNARADGRTSPT